MIFLRSFALFLLFALAGPAFAQNGGGWLYEGSDIPPDPAWRLGTLDNGLRYAVRRNDRPAGQVSIRLRIDAGALHEADEERGWAHYVEHMLFRGTENYRDRQARQIWQQLGASFGSDTNATTSATETIYQLDLPDAERADLDASLRVLADMMQAPLFDPEAVAGERRVLLAEMERRSELSALLSEASRDLFYAGLKFADRDTIGTEGTLQGATAEGLRAFHRRWYRPERTTIVMAGDFDEQEMAALIAEHFGGWSAEGPPPAEPHYGAIAEPRDRIEAVAYEGAPATAALAWLRPYVAHPHTKERERLFMEEALAARIINRRLEAHARGDSDFISASVGLSRNRGIAEETRLTVTARDGDWRGALGESFAILGDAVRAPPSAAEIERELANLRSAVQSAVESEPTMLSQQHAARLVGAIDNGAVVTTAANVLANFEEYAPTMTPDRIGAAMAGLFTGAGPRMILLTPEPVEGGEVAIAAGLAAAEAVAPAVRAADRTVSLDDLPPLGPPGREVSRERVEDMDVTIVRFANGSTLTFKPTRFEQGIVHVRLRFGEGIAGLDPDEPSLAWLGGLVGPSGLADLDLDAMERMLTGRRIGLAFGVGEDAFVLSGQTNAADLPDQLRLLATKLAHPRWDAELFDRFRASAVESFDLHFSSASARARRELPGVLRPGDARWQPVPKEKMAAATVEEFQLYFEPLLAAGPVHAIIVGDIPLEAAVDAMERSVAALPPRPEAQVPAEARDVEPPAPNPEPVRFTHQGDPAQAFALIGWTTLGGVENTRERRALSLAANMLQARLFDRLREEEGTTYSPNASHLGSEEFADWGVFYAAAEIRPESADTFFRIAREEVASLAATPAAADEFARAQNPVVSGIERRVETNSYWLGALDDWTEDPREIDNVRNYLDHYRGLTPELVQEAVARRVTDEGDWSMLVLPEGGASAGAEAGE